MNYQEEIEHLTARCYTLAGALVEHCKHKLVETDICGFFDEGPRYRKACTLISCPALEEGKEPEILTIKSKDVKGLLPSGELSEEDTYGTFTKRTAGEKEQE